MARHWVDRARIGLAAAVRGRIAGPDFEAAHRRIWDTAGPRWFGEQDPIWRVHADTSMFVGGIRALLLQSLHPVAMVAVSTHSGFRGDPWGRLHRTSYFLASTTYGTIEHAEAAIERVRAIHRRVGGTTARGETYRADDPQLLSWVHLAEVDSFLVTHQTFGRRRLDPAEADTYVRQTALVAHRLGVPDPPENVTELDAQLAAFRPELRLTRQAHEAAELLLRDPPLPAPHRFGYAMLAAGAVSTLPAWARAELRLPSLPTADRLVARPLTRTALGTIRWALAAQAA